MSTEWMSAAVGMVQSDSTAGRLTNEESLRSLEGEGPHNAALIPENFPEIRILPGKTREYLYNSRIMSETYAEILFHNEEKDYRGQILQTVQRESRLYPRTTAVARFLEPPYSIPGEVLPVIVEALLAEGELIGRYRASNGAEHLFSPRDLVRAQAEYLAEWEEVGVFESQ